MSAAATASRPARSTGRPRANGGAPASTGPLRGRGGSPLGQLGSRGRLGLAVAAALILGLLGFMIGVNVGRPSWPADGSADVGFARDMSAHHAQAVEMGMAAFDRATHEHVRSLGYDIALTQKGQIGTMQAWLDTWGVPKNTDDPPMAWVPGGDEMVKGNLMPGMATREEMNQLLTATGEQVDILFLQYMLRHHLGGIHMTDEVLARDPSPPVRELAEAMKRGQEAEVTVMQNLLAEFGASPLPN